MSLAPGKDLWHAYVGRFQNGHSAHTGFWQTAMWVLLQLVCTKTPHSAISYRPAVHLHLCKILWCPCTPQQICSKPFLFEREQKGDEASDGFMGEVKYGGNYRVKWSCYSNYLTICFQIGRADHKEIALVDWTIITLGKKFICMNSLYPKAYLNPKSKLEMYCSSSVPGCGGCIRFSFSYILFSLSGSRQ